MIKSLRKSLKKTKTFTVNAETPDQSANVVRKRKRPVEELNASDEVAPDTTAVVKKSKLVKSKSLDEITNDSGDVEMKPVSIKTAKTMSKTDSFVKKAKGFVKPAAKSVSGISRDKALSKKERRVLKKNQKNHSELIEELLKLWEEFRHEKCTSKRLNEICSLILKKSQGKIKELIFSHDTVRIFESLLKLGSDEHRWTVFEALKEDILLLCKSRYAKFIVEKFLQYGPKDHKAYIIRKFEGHVVELIKHKFAGDIVELAYNDHANAQQRANIIQEFYGTEFSIFKSTSVSKLPDAFTADPSKKQSTLDHVHSILLSLCAKGLTKHSLVQHVLLEYFLHSEDNPKVQELAESLKENLVPMLHTRDGVKCALHVIWLCSSKDHKRLLKSMKTFISTTCVNEHGYLAILALFDSVKNPEILQKFVLKEIFESLEDVLSSAYGRKVLLYLLSPRDPLHFSPQLMSLLKRQSVPEVSLDQLKEKLQQALSLYSIRLLTHIADNMQPLVSSNSTLLFVMDSLRYCPGDKTRALEALTALVCQPFVPAEKGQEADHIIERSAGHLALNRLILHEPQFVELVNSSASDSVLLSWLKCNRGCFLLLHLFEHAQAGSSLPLRFKRLFYTLDLQSVPFKGAALLSEKLNAKKT